MMSSGMTEPLFLGLAMLEIAYLEHPCLMMMRPYCTHQRGNDLMLNEKDIYLFTATAADVDNGLWGLFWVDIESMLYLQNLRSSLGTIIVE
mmetsp:Transcript_15269/g.20864  ORF Transcript_15269/g.20864 Transcript_15269/m.20864 type:complete len:91 (+) Transcript_15269:709-981(+)